ncbi:MAG: orotate phosphoribosyltransferase [Saprospiraceae bacterium]|jgi:orotate phosphoribosyltransferase
MDIAATVAQQLLQIKAIKLSPQNPFTWASGIKSPIYCDNRIVLSHPKARNIVKEALVKKASQFGEFDVIAGVATAGIPHGALLADAMNMPFIYVRSKAKEHGRQNLIEGEIKGGERVLIIEDLISTGGSSVKAIESVREAGCEVVGALAIFSYGFEKAKRTFDAANCKFDTLSNYDAMIKEAIASGYVTEADVEMLQEFRTRVGKAS